MLLLTYYMWTCACVCTHTHTHTHEKQEHSSCSGATSRDRAPVCARRSSKGQASSPCSRQKWGMRPPLRLWGAPEGSWIGFYFATPLSLHTYLKWGMRPPLPRSSRHTHTQTDRQTHTHRLRRAPEGSWNIFSFSAPWCAGQCEGVDVACGLTTSSY